MSVFSKFLALVNGVPRTTDLSTNTLSVQGLQINAATGGGAITQSAHSTTSSYSIVWPQAQAASSNYTLVNDGSGNLSWTSITSGSVTSVALADDSSTPIYSISGSPVTSSGTLGITLVNQAANSVFAGPSSGSAAQPGFRSLVLNDIPNLSSLYLALSGGTMSGPINMGSNKITNLANGSGANDAVTFGQLENALSGVQWRPEANLLDTVDTSLPATTATTIDGQTVANGNRVLFTNLSALTPTGTFSNNSNSITVSSATGLYVGMSISDTTNSSYIPAGTIITNIVSTTLTISQNTAGAGSSDSLSISGNEDVWVAAVSGSTITWSLAYDNDRSSPAAKQGDSILILSGTNNALSAWNFNGSSWVQFNGANQVQAGSALSKSGNTLNVLYDNSTVGLNGSNQLYVPTSGITATQLASNSVTSAKIATSAIGNGLSGGGGSALTVVSASGSAIAVSSGGVSVSVGSSGGIQVSSSALSLLLADTSLSTSSSGVKVNLATSSGLVVSSGLAVNPDGSSLDINGSNQVEIKSGGVTTAKLGTITDGITLDQSGSGSTLEIKAGGVGTSQLASNAVTSSKIATSALDQVTITGGGGSTIAVQQSPTVQKVLLAGQAFSANISYAVRYGLNANSETTNEIYAADQNTASYDLFWCIGMAQSGSAVSSGGNMNVMMKGLFTLGSGDTDFVTGDIGKPVYLTSSGAFSTTAPSASGDAVVKIGVVASTTTMWIEPQVLAVN